MLLNRFQLYQPTSTRDAARLFRELEDVKVLAGGTFLLNSLKLLKTKGTRTCKNVLSLNKVNELYGVEKKDGLLMIKAMTNINQLKSHPNIPQELNVLRTVCQNISTNPIRNMATIGGNLTCRYTWTEFGAVMIAMDATMYFMSPEGNTTGISAEDFFKNNARCESLFTHVTIPIKAGVRFGYQRVKKTQHVDVPLLALCISACLKEGRLTGVRVGINSATAFAQRDLTLEEFLNKTPMSDDLPQNALNHLTSEIYETRSSDYKKHMFQVSIKRAIADLVKGVS